MSDSLPSPLRVCLSVPARDSAYSARYARMNDLVTDAQAEGRPVDFHVIAAADIAPGRPAVLRAVAAWRRIIAAARSADVVHFVAVGWAVMPAFLWVRYGQRKPLVAGPNLYFLQFSTRHDHPQGTELIAPLALQALAQDARRRRPMQTSRWARRIERVRWRLIERADRILALGTFCREVGLVFGADRARIDVLPLTAPEEPGEKPGPPLADLTRAPGRPTVLYMGALNQLKGFDQFAALIDRIEPGRVRFVIAGTGPLKQAAEQLAQTRSDVDYMGYVDRRTLLAALPAIDLYVQPSIWDLISTTMLEALRNGVPVLSSDLLSAQELADQAPDAMRLFPLGHGDAFEAAFREMIDEIDSYRAAARAAAGRFAMERAWEFIARLYDGLAGHRR